MDQILQWFEANAGKIIFLLVAIVAALLITKGLARVMRKVLDRTDMPSASIFINIMRVLVWILAASRAAAGVRHQPDDTDDRARRRRHRRVAGSERHRGERDLGLRADARQGDTAGRSGVGRGTAGVVKDITWRQTVVRERNGNEMVIPNSVLNTASLEKLTPSNEGCVTMTFTAKAGSDPAHVTEAVKRAVATATVEFAQPGSEPLVKLTGFSPYGIEVQALAFTRDGVFLSTMRDAMARAIAGCEFVEQRAAVGE